MYIPPPTPSELADEIERMASVPGYPRFERIMVDNWIMVVNALRIMKVIEPDVLEVLICHRDPSASVVLEKISDLCKKHIANQPVSGDNHPASQ